MEFIDVERVCSPEAMALLASLPAYDEAGALALGEQLRRAGHDASLVAAVLTQSRLRTRTRPRWGALVDQLVLTPDGAEQGTRPVVAAHRADRFAAAGIGSVVDLGSGLGMDALALASAGITVCAFERDPTTAAAARANVAALGLSHLMTVECSDVMTTDLTELLHESGCVFADPARRRNGRRLMHPEQWSPPLRWLLNLPVAALGVKVAPGLAHDAAPGESEFEVVSVDGDVVEGGLYRGVLGGGQIRRRATLLPSGTTITNLDLPAEAPHVGVVGQFLHEPDGAVIRAGLVGVVVAELDGRLLDASIAYVTTDRERRSPLTTAYEVTEVLPFSLKRLRMLLRARGVGRVTIKKRGSAVDPESLRRQLKLDKAASGEATVFLTRLAGAPTVLLAQPIAKAIAD